MAVLMYGMIVIIQRELVETDRWPSGGMDTLLKPYCFMRQLGKSMAGDGAYITANIFVSPKVWQVILILCY